jgi:hypothetical protein
VLTCGGQQNYYPRLILQVPLAKWVVIAGPPGTGGDHLYVLADKRVPKVKKKRGRSSGRSSGRSPADRKKVLVGDSA